MLTGLLERRELTRLELVEALFEGDAEAWLLVLMATVPIVLALIVAGLYLRIRKKAQATSASLAQVAHSWQQHRTLALTTLLIGSPVAVTLAVLLYSALQSIIAFVPLSVFFLVAIVIGVLNWRCPACGGHMGSNSNPKYCPHCGIQVSTGKGLVAGIYCVLGALAKRKMRMTMILGAASRTRCLKCDHDNDASAKFCTNCGFPVR